MARLEEYADLRLLPEKGKVIVGFSGGADSTALLHFLLGKIENDRICCVHLHHGLRGEEADRDAAAAEEFCAQRGLRFHLFRADVAARARAEKIGVEECGRKLRYACFESLIESENDRILTAHHADDNAETMLMHLAKGAALAGLCGIPAARGNILRPLLMVPRAEIERYCREEGLSFSEDTTNTEDGYTRNWVRLHLMPLMRELNPSFVESASQTMRALRLDEEELSAQARELLGRARVGKGLSAAVLQESGAAVRRRAIKRFLEENGSGRLTALHIEQAAELLSNGSRLSIPGGKRLECSGGILLLTENAEPLHWQKEIYDRKTVLPNGKSLILQNRSVYDIINTKKINNLLFNFSFDCATIGGDLQARSRRSGDRFAPVNRRVTKSLKKLFREAGIPLSERNSMVVLESAGEIVFVEGVGVAEAFRVTKETKQAVTVQIEAPME